MPRGSLQLITYFENFFGISQKLAGGTLLQNLYGSPSSLSKEKQSNIISVSESDSQIPLQANKLRGVCDSILSKDPICLIVKSFICDLRGSHVGFSSNYRFQATRYDISESLTNLKSWLLGQGSTAFPP
jgi:hypothetical protein